MDESVSSISAHQQAAGTPEWEALGQSQQISIRMDAVRRRGLAAIPFKLILDI